MALSLMLNKNLLSFLILLGKTSFLGKNLTKKGLMMLSDSHNWKGTFKLSLTKESTPSLEKEESIFLEDKKPESV
jgi:hypothetical protein